MGIDLVYLWVDGSDPIWLKKKNEFLGIETEINSEQNCKGRYADNNELKYSLRSVSKNIPWIRKIFIVTDNQVPDWLDTKNSQIEIIDHKDILPSEALPCFNASVIEYFLHKIPDLSEHFIYANDDLFFYSPLDPSFFFAEDKYPIVRLKRKFLGKWHYRVKFLRKKGPGQYRRMIHDAATLVEEKTTKYYSGLPHHNVDAYVKSDYRLVMEDIFSDAVEKSLSHHIRTVGDFHRSAVLYYALSIGHGHIRYVNRKETLRIFVYKPDFMKVLMKYQPKLFCLNDSQRVNDSDRERIEPFLKKLFPDKSVFEK